MNSSITKNPSIITQKTVGKGKKLYEESFTEKIEQKKTAWPLKSRFETRGNNCSGCSLLGLEKEVAQLRSDLQEYQIILQELKISLIQKNEEITELRRDLVIL